MSIIKKLHSIKNSIFEKISMIKYHGLKRPFWFTYNLQNPSINGMQYKIFINTLQHLDVILRKSDDYLDTYFIRGFWNHAGVYNKKTGKIVHAMADGVRSECPYDFAKTDHLMIIRPMFLLDEKSIAEAEKKCDEVIGKKYDFSFDFSNYRRLSCTENVEYIFNHCDNKIPVSTNLFQKAIFPDDLPKGNFKTVFDSRLYMKS